MAYCSVENRGALYVKRKSFCQLSVTHTLIFAENSQRLLNVCTFLLISGTPYNINARLCLIRTMKY